jgi:hypothetical protein
MQDNAILPEPNTSLPKPNDRKLLLIGWDAADWKVALPLIKRARCRISRH